MRDRFISFVLHFGKRRSKGQKNRFISALFDMMNPLGYELKAHQFKHAGKIGKNIIAGDLNNAKIVYMVDYDTKERVFNNAFRYYPFDEAFNMKVLRSNLLKYFICSCGAMGLMILSFLRANQAEGHFVYFYYAGAAFAAIVSFIFARGVASPYNFKKTASIFALCEIAKNNNQCCYVFLDQSLFVGIGKYRFFQEYDLKGKIIIYLDNAAIGSLKVAKVSKNAPRSLITYLQKNEEIDDVLVEQLETAENNEFVYIYVTLCEKDEEGNHYIDHISTKTDSEFVEDDFGKAINVIQEIQTKILK